MNPIDEARIEQMAHRILDDGGRIAAHLKEEQDLHRDTDAFMRGLSDQDLLAAGCYAVMHGLVLVAMTVGHEEGRRAGLAEGGAP